MALKEFVQHAKESRVQGGVKTSKVCTVYLWDICGILS